MDFGRVRSKLLQIEYDPETGEWSGSPAAVALVRCAAGLIPRAGHHESGPEYVARVFRAALPGLSVDDLVADPPRPSTLPPGAVD